MTNEELFAKGDFGQLYEQNKRYIYSLIKKFPNVSPEDVISAGNLGFTKALKSYSLDKGIKFLSYASKCIGNEIFMFIRENKKHERDISLNGSINIDKEGNELTLEDVIALDTDIEEDYIQKETHERLYMAISQLPEKTRKLMLLELQGKNQLDIAEALNFSQSYISRLKGKAQIKLKKLMEGGKLMNNREITFKMFEQGFSNQEIADKLHLSLTTVLTYKTSYNKIKGIFNNNNNSKSSKKNKAFELFDIGMDPKQVAEKIGIPVQTVNHYRKEYKYIMKYKNDNIGTETNNIQDKSAPTFDIGEQQDTHKEEKHAVSEKKTPVKLLKATEYKGALMNYSIAEETVKIIYTCGELLIPKDSIKLLIEELKELEEVI